jgi:PelA/Pel-15E family pectate lyase
MAAAAEPEPADLAAAKNRTWKAIDTGAFRDSIHHAVMRYQGQKAPYQQYRPEQIVHIAENLLAAQNKDGGWPKNKDWTKVGLKVRGGSTFDNSNIWPQVEYLARVRQQTGLERYVPSTLRAIDHILAEQHRESGGWRGADVNAVTYNDHVMAGIMATLKLILDERKLFDFVEGERLTKVQRAWDRGLACILKSQVKLDGKLTLWGQQHRHQDLKVVRARTFEPAALTTAESVKVVHLLMSIEKPTPEVIAAVQAAVKWFDTHKIEGLRIDKVPAKKTKFAYHTSDFDRVEVKDPDAPPIWTRFYDLKEQKPLFCTRQKVETRNYTDLSRERRTGYAWYGNWAVKLLSEDYPAWQAKHAPGDNALEPSARQGSDALSAPPPRKSAPANKMMFTQ